MSTVKNIQEKLGRYSLKKEQKHLKRNVKAFNIEKASTIGVIYNATNRSDAETVKKFIQYLKEERKDVLSLGFIDSKDSSDIVKPHLNYTYFDKQNLSKALVPKGNDVETAAAANDYQAVLTTLASLKTVVDDFFDNVMVMADDENLKNNRLAILQTLRNYFLLVADISLLANK